MSEICEIHEEHRELIEKAMERMPEDEEMLMAADFFDALGNPTRLKILMAIMEVELCTCDLSAVTGLSTSAISHQLRILKDRRIVAYRKEGRNVFYRLDDRHIREILRKAMEHLSE